MPQTYATLVTMKSAYQTPITVREALERIHRHDYVLPAIQREFVWEPEQMCRLFDSLLRGYPIGTFLLWSVRAETASEFQFYDVVRNYHELKSPHSEKVAFPQPREVTAILDGQQRMTSLNIGLCGTYAEKIPRKRASNLDAYPPKRLRLDLCHRGAEEDDLLYRFAFLSDGETASRNTGESHWYTVADALDLTDAGPAVFTYVQRVGLESHAYAFHTLARLRQAVHDDGVISYFLEDSQELDKVLDIFIRVNSGGTVLSKSDLLLSVATAQFQTIDARDSVHGLVDDLNAIGHGFAFSQDLVLKSALVLSDVGDIAFKVQNFTASNIAILERTWGAIDHALRLAAKLLASYGFSDTTLKANSVLIPVAHYLHSRRHDDTYLTIAKFKDDRERVRQWVIRTLVRPGVWGSGLDTLLKSLRAVVNESEGSYPVASLEVAMARQGKSLAIDADVLDDLAELPYRDRRVFAVLALLYPGVDVRNEFHIDHVFPKSLFTKARLAAAGVPASAAEAYRGRFDRLPNLQLLVGSDNESKRDRLPADWARERFPEPAARSAWLAGQDMHDLPVDLEAFLEFYEVRRLRMRERLASILGVAVSPPADTMNLRASSSETSDGPERSTHETLEGFETGGRAVYQESLLDLIRRGAIEAGEKLTGTHHGRTYTVSVTTYGTITNGESVYESLSQAARLLTGQSAVNGWLFWRAAEGTPVGELRRRH